jgi:hypothetical protein
MQNYFSGYKDQDLALHGLSGLLRKPSHSTSNVLSSRTSSGVAFKTGSTLGNLGKAGLGFATAAGAVAAGGTPLIPAAAAVIGLGYLAYEAYTDREKHHINMAKHINSLIDDVPPKVNFYASNDANLIKEVSGNATYLIRHGQNQIILLQQKFDEDFRKFKEFITVYFSAAEKCTTSHDFIKLHAMNETAIKQGGPIFEFMRRLVHVGNYMQSPFILAHAAQFNLKGSMQVQLQDPLLFWSYTDHIRNYLFSVGKKMKLIDDELLNRHDSDGFTFA